MTTDEIQQLKDAREQARAGQRDAQDKLSRLQQSRTTMTKALDQADYKAAKAMQSSRQDNAALAAKRTADHDREKVQEIRAGIRDLNEQIDVAEGELADRTAAAEQAAAALASARQARRAAARS